MKWRRDNAQSEDSTPMIELTHISGNVILEAPTARVTDNGTEIRGMIDPATWRRIRDNDIFGASSRVQSTGALPEDVDLRITLTTAESLPTESIAVAAELFVIVDAMRQVDPAELQAAGLEGEVWDGVIFSEPQPWSEAIRSLTDQGFEPFDGLASATTMRRDSDGVNVEFRHHDGAEIVQIQVVLELPDGDDVAAGAYETVNGVNSALPFSTTLIDAGDLIIRETVPDELGTAASALIESRTTDLVELIGIVREPLWRVLRGELAPMAALEEMFA